MKIHYKSHYILTTKQGQFLAMRHSMFNMGIHPTIDLAKSACDNGGK